MVRLQLVPIGSETVLVERYARWLGVAGTEPIRHAKFLVEVGAHHQMRTSLLVMLFVVEAVRLVVLGTTPVGSCASIRQRNASIRVAEHSVDAEERTEVHMRCSGCDRLDPGEPGPCAGRK